MLAVRVQNARAIADAGLVSITKRDKDGKAKVLVVPGTKGKQYQVILRRSGTWTVECSLITPAGEVACKGNSNGYICYHSLAAIFTAAKECRCCVKVIESRDGADRLARLGGTVYELRSYQGTGRLWLVVTSLPAQAGQKKSAKQDMADLFGVDLDWEKWKAKDWANAHCDERPI